MKCKDWKWYVNNGYVVCETEHILISYKNRKKTTAEIILDVRSDMLYWQEGEQ